MKRCVAACLLLVAILVVTGCGGGTGGGTTPPPSSVAPSITAQPQSQTVTAGQTATFSVTATGTPAPTYQWMKGGTAISGATSSSYTTPATTTADSGSSFTVTVSNSAGSKTSSAATLTVNAAPVAPTVTATSPTSSATNVGISAAVSATFSVAMDATTITNSTFTVTGPGGAAVTGTVGLSGQVATFAPSASLAYNTQYTATITTGVKSGSGVALASNYQWSFTTAQAPAPTVTATTPANNATSVAVSTILTATFSQAMTASTITTSTFKLAGPGGAAVTGTVTYDANAHAATFTPSSDLAYNTQYTATITTGVTNSSGIALASNYQWTFTTAQGSVPPTVTSTTPASSATNVDINTAITATFSEAMDSSTITSNTFKVSGGGVYLTGTVTYTSASQVATFTPSVALNYNTTYTATITTGVTAADGTAMAAQKVWSFTTGSPAATIDFGTTKQTIRGFGASTAWQQTVASARADALFGTLDNQIGLSILRVRIDPTSTTAGAQWYAELGNALLAKARGAVTMATAWTPPAAWKIESASQPFYTPKLPTDPPCDQTPSTLCGGYLDPAHYGDYAAYLESFVNYFQTGGVDLYAISMQNEPDWLPHYESCSWTADQIHTWVANNASVLTTRLIMPESLNFNKNLSDPTLNDAAAAANVSIVGGHLYGVSPSYYTNAFDKGKEVWMTEHDYTPSGTQPVIGDALIAAKEIHDSLTVGSYNAYLWWWAANWYTGMKTGLIDMSNNPTYYGYAMSQYSRFIRPGYVRVNATANPTSGIYVSAYSGNGHYVVVAINNSASSVNQPFTIQGQTLTTLTPFQTTSTLHVAPQTGVDASSGSFNYVLPAQSITTFVQ
jgi:O-glycosyl hydrolase